MSDMMAGGAIESLIQSYFKAYAASLPAVTFILALNDSEGEADPTVWHSIYASGHISADLTIAFEDAEHPVIRAVQLGIIVQGQPTEQWGALFAGYHWAVLPAITPTTDPLVRAVLLCFSSASFATEQMANATQLATLLGAVLAGASVALHQRREADQLTLLMHYAANPIILTDATTIVSMNAPALQLFDSTSVEEGEQSSEYHAAVQRNVFRLQEFLKQITADTSSVFSGELALEDPTTQDTIIMAIACTQVPDAISGERGTVLVLHDMTRARELEQHRMREQLFESEKMAATGRLAASIAHEINNPLEAIKNSLYLLVQQSDEDDPNRQFLELAQRETERVSRIIRQMLGVSRPSIAKSAVNVNEILLDALQLLGPQLRQGKVLVHLQLDDSLPTINASADQLKQVFLNLILNAKEAMLQGGGLLIQTRLAHEGDTEFLAGRHVIVRIRDDGAGIPAEVLPRVFEPFFSTKMERHGTGLGLWVCKDIIQHHGGQIIVRSMVGKGTTFLIALPFGDESSRSEGAALT